MNREEQRRQTAVSPHSPGALRTWMERVGGGAARRAWRETLEGTQKQVGGQFLSLKLVTIGDKACEFMPGLEKRAQLWSS